MEQQQRRSKRRTFGNLVILALAVIGILMAAYADRVDRQQQQQWERIH